jgi:hypothetical protein
MTTFTIHTENKEHLNALKAVLKALKIKFEIHKDDEPYNPEYVSKILESKKQIKKGKSTKVTMDNLDSFLGL